MDFHLTIKWNKPQQPHGRISETLCLAKKVHAVFYHLNEILANLKE